MKKLLRLFAAAVLGLGLGVSGIAAAQTADVDETGPLSSVEIDFENEYDATVDNNNDVGLTFNNNQGAASGTAVVSTNTTGDDAVSGDAMNDNEVMVDGEIDNSGANAAVAGMNWGGSDTEASVSNTGPQSDVDIDFDNSYDLDIDNDTDLDVTSNNTQSAASGDATVSNNTTGGGAMTGDATNTSSTTINFTVRN